MKVVEWFNSLLQYIEGGIARIFSPRDDNYPATGEQPFTGDPNSSDS